MPSPLPQYAYLGVSQKGDLELVISPEKLHCVGKRLTQGNDFPPEVYNLYSEPITLDVCVSAIKALEGFLSGQIVVNPAMDFGQKAPKVKKTQ